MKKLFFSALVAIVAVGGALSTNANLYRLASTEVFYCTDTFSATCAWYYGTNEATDGPGQTSPIIDISHYHYQP